MIMRLKATIQSLEEQMSSVTEKSAKYAQIAAEEVPKSLYCLGGKLAERIYVVASKLTDNSLYHVYVFSNNIVATSVVVNSTALKSKAPEKFVLHLVTNAMKSCMWKLQVTSVQSSLFLEAAFASNDMQHLAAMLRVLSELIPGFKETTEYYTF
ncbi:probable galacturonosyltransferase 10 [Brassica rapa]|uniref:probable galacturonosyltransferase 10 n=1 Tax=Brassica campestris TaxID=3711 RepID=UPI00142E58DE|nr:probable galacturonosyltransferase 10 [Brassica rapa]